MFDHTDMDPRELPLSTLGMVFVFLPLIIASLYFRVLEKMVKEDVKKKEDKTSAIDVTSYDSLVTLVNDLAEFGWIFLSLDFVCVRVHEKCRSAKGFVGDFGDEQRADRRVEGMDAISFFDVSLG